MKNLIIIGCGGHAKSVADVLEAQGEYKIRGFIDKEAKTYRDYRTIGTDDDLETLFEEGVRYAAIGIGFMGKSNLREQIYRRLKEYGYQFPAIVDPTAILAGDAVLGEGTFVGKRAVVNADTRIGRMTIINTGAIIEHNCAVDDFSHVAVGSCICGGAVLGKRVFIGANATVIQQIKIGDDAIIGAGAVVCRNVENGRTVRGVPAG